MIDFKYRPDVDGLRAVAVLLVLFFHAGMQTSGGYVGVDVFFVISGFLITGLILKEQRAGTFSLSEFWIRRIRRIVPASTVVVAVTLVYGGVTLMPFDYDELGRSAVAQQLMCSNVFFWQSAGYFGGDSELKPLLHTWSLAVEEQFYLIYPFVFVARFRTNRAAATLGLLMAGSFALSEWGSRNSPSAAFYLLPTRAWEMLLGGLLCFLPVPSRLSDRQSNFLGWMGISAVLTAAFLYDSKTRFPGVSGLLPCVGTGLVIYSSSQKLTSLGRLLATPPLVGIGLLSYSLYLWHWPLIVYYRHTLGETEPTTSGMILILGFSFILAYLSWKYIETPFRRKKFLLTRRTVLAAATASAFLIVTSSAYIVRQGGFQANADSRVVAYMSAADSRHTIHNVNLTPNQLKRGEVPILGAKEGRVTCLIWGDSHVMTLVPVLDVTCRDRGMKFYQATHSSTAPLLGFSSVGKWSLGEESREFNQAVVDYVARNRIDLVILAAMWSTYADDPGFSRCLKDTVEALRHAGARVAVVRDVALQNGNVPRILAKAAYDGRDVQRIGTSDVEYRAANATSEQAFQALDSRHVTLLDPAPYLVDIKEIWRAEYDGTAMYRDAHHLSIEGAMRLRPLFRKLTSGVVARTAAK